MAKEIVYVTFTCKHCGNAFIDEDVNNDINDEPLKTRYCPKCVELGYVNKKKLTPEQERKKYIKNKLKENNITDKKDIQFVQKYINKQIAYKQSTSQKIIINHIFNSALEVLSYQDWKQ